MSAADSDGYSHLTSPIEDRISTVNIALIDIEKTQYHLPIQSGVVVLLINPNNMHTNML